MVGNAAKSVGERDLRARERVGRLGLEPSRFARNLPRGHFLVDGVVGLHLSESSLARGDELARTRVDLLVLRPRAFGLDDERVRLALALGTLSLGVEVRIDRVGDGARAAR